MPKRIVLRVSGDRESVAGDDQASPMHRVPTNHPPFEIRVTSRRMASSGVRAVYAWLTVIGLLAHLAVAGTCPVEAKTASVLTAFPICHAHDPDRRVETPTDSSRGGTPPSGHHDHCDVCAAHCHATATLPPDVVMVRPAPVVSPDAIDPPSPRASYVRLCVGASPRGPPPSI